MSQTASPAPACAISDRLALIIEGLCQAVARRGGILGGLAGPLIILIWSRLRRITARFTRAAATSPAPSRPAAKRPARPRRSQPFSLPRRKAWLLRLVPETASGASQLCHFLADPETAALLAAAPQLRRILRPLCGMLGIRPTQALRPSPPMPPAPPPDAPPAAPPIHVPRQAAPVAVPPLAFPPWPAPPAWA